MFQFIVDKVKARLFGWDVRKLSLAGRLTLVKFVLLSILNYFMSTVRIPITICNKIEKLARAFLWRSFTFIRKPSLVNWNVCCWSKDNGGLGIRSLQVQNKFFLMKLGFNLIANPGAFWVRILRNKYSIHSLVPKDIRRSCPSYLWRFLMQIWDKVKKRYYLDYS